MATSSPLAPDVPFASLNGLRVVKGSLRVPGTGLWTADLMLDAVPLDALPTGPLAATLMIGDLTLRGTLLADHSGSFAAAGWYRVVAGAGGWAALLASRAYHNDAGLVLGDLVEDLVGDAGETLAAVDDAPAAVLLQGVDYARATAPAARALGELLALAAPSASWWVDYDGGTHVGARPIVPPTPGFAFDLLDYDPAQRVLDLASDTLAPLTPGSLIIDARLTAPLVVRELEILVGEKLRTRAWVDEQPASPGPHALDNRLMRALRGAVREALPQLAYLGVYRYRVVTMTSGRADLQAVDPSRGLPDLQLVRLGPGLAGGESKLTPGCVVLLAFADGDPSQPLIVNYSPTDDAAFVPVTSTLSSPTTVLYAPGGGDVPDQYVKISKENGFDVQTLWGRLTLGPAGFHLTTTCGGRLDMFAIGGLPGFLSALGGMAILQAPVATVKGGAVNLGSDGGATNEGATKALGVFLTALVGAISTISTATPGSAAMAAIDPLMPALLLTLAQIGKVV